MPVSCYLRFVAEELRVKRDVVLAAVARSGYELEFAGEALRADPYVVAWAGAPVGAALRRDLSKTFVQLFKFGVSVQHIDENWKLILNDTDCVAAWKGPIALSLVERWPELAQERPNVENPQLLNNKPQVCDLIQFCLSRHCQLFFCVAPPVRDLLWPT